MAALYELLCKHYQGVASEYIKHAECELATSSLALPSSGPVSWCVVERPLKLLIRHKGCVSVNDGLPGSSCRSTVQFVAFGFFFLVLSLSLVAH